MVICQRCLCPICHHYGLLASNPPVPGRRKNQRLDFSPLLASSLTGCWCMFLLESRCDWSQRKRLADLSFQRFFLAHLLHTVEHGCALLGFFSCQLHVSRSHVVSVIHCLQRWKCWHGRMWWLGMRSSSSWIFRKLRGTRGCARLRPSPFFPPSKELTRNPPEPCWCV